MERDDVLALVRSRVQMRFQAPTAEEITDHVLARAREAGQDPLALARSLALDDLYLAQACARGDEAAWNECSRAHFPFMRDFARRFLRAADAADLCDRVIADLWTKRKLARYEGRSTLRTWLGAVVAHAALQAGKVVRQRDLDRDLTGIEQPAAHGRSPEDAHEARALARITADAIRSLPDDDKLLLLLHYEQGLSLEQMAPLLKTSKATLSRRLKRTRESLRRTIEAAAREERAASGSGTRTRTDLASADFDLSALLRGIGLVKGRGGDSV